MFHIIIDQNMRHDFFEFIHGKETSRALRLPNSPRAMIWTSVYRSLDSSVRIGILTVPISREPEGVVLSNTQDLVASNSPKDFSLPRVYDP